MEPETNPALQAFDSFAQAASLEDLRQFMINHPIFLEADFVEVISQAISEQISADHQPVFQQRLTWLQQIIQE